MLAHSPHEVPLVLDSGQHVAAGDGSIISVIKEEVRVPIRASKLHLIPSENY